MTPEENDLLCRVEGNAPMGAIMRRHWIAACLAEEVAEPDGKPVRVRLLGESLVVFRDSQGRLGVLDEYCSHRRASLVYARNEECGLRCLYHGWKFDVEGNVVEMASEPAESNIPQRVKHKAYPAREAGGFVWCYMGPAAEMPAFEAPAFAPSADVRVSATKVRVRCNWAQILEGQIDSAHSSSLHSSDMVPAQVDGASTWSQFRHIELPYLRPLLLLVLFFRLADVIRVFDHVYVLTGGGPGTTTQYLSLYIYRIGFQFTDLSQASALAVLVMAAMTIFYTIVSRFLPADRG